MVLNIRNIAAIAYSYFLIFSGKIKRVKKMAAKGEIILSVYFHNPKKELFNNCVKWFLKNGFHFISVDELNIIIENNDPFPPSSVVFTVDDGWKENKENIISVVDKYKIPLTIFITTSPVETGEAYWWSYALKANQQGIISNSVENLKRVSNLNRLSIIENVKSKIKLNREALSINEIKEINQIKYLTIGSHTVNHPILTNCDHDTSHLEIIESKNKIEKWIRNPVLHFAYPNGCYSYREINILKNNGYKTAFTTVPDYVKNTKYLDKFQIPRFDVLENISNIENLCRMTGIWFDRKK